MYNTTPICKSWGTLWNTGQKYWKTQMTRKSAVGLYSLEMTGKLQPLFYNNMFKLEWNSNNTHRHINVEGERFMDTTPGHTTTGCL